MDDVIDGRGWETTKGGRDWGEDAVFWLDRVVRKETQIASLSKLRDRVSDRKRFSKALAVEFMTPTRGMICWCRFTEGTGTRR